LKTENLKALKIHRLTEEQLQREKEAGRLDGTALYLTPAKDTSPIVVFEGLRQTSPAAFTAPFTIEQIKAEMDAKKIVLLLDAHGRYYQAVPSDGGSVQFYDVLAGAKDYDIAYHIDATGTWSRYTEQPRRSVTEIGSSSDDNKVPTAKAVYDFVTEAIESGSSGSTGDYVPTSRTVNGKALSEDITLSASDVGAVPTSRTVNNKALSGNITLSASDVNAVPTSRTVNGKALSGNITLSASDVGAAESGHSHSSYFKTYSAPNEVDPANTSGSFSVARTSSDAPIGTQMVNVSQFQGENFRVQLGIAVNPSTDGTRSTTAWIRDKHNSGSNAWSKWSELLVANREQTITGKKTFNSSNFFNGEQKFFNTEYCPEVADTAGGVGCAFKASRGLYNEALLDKIIMTATTGKIPFYKYNGTSGGNMTGLTEVASIDANGALTVSGTSTLKNIEASNEYLTGSLYVGGKRGTSDGKTGVAFGSKGNVTMQGESEPALNFIVGSETSAKAKISAKSNGVLNLIGKTKVAFNTGSAEVAAIDSNGKLACGDIAAANITGTSIASSTFNFTNQFNLTNTVISKGLKFFATCLSPDENSAGITLGQSGCRFGTIYSNTALNTPSDRNLKTDIQQIDERYVNLFDKLEPVSYKLKGGNHDRDHLGFISQDIWASMCEVGISDMDFGGFCRDAKTKEIIDEETGEVIGTEPVLDENGEQEYTYSLRYGEFIPLNSKMIQINRATIAAQQEEINSLKTEITELREAVAALLDK
jgi:hypothetical protein